MRKKRIAFVSNGGFGTGNYSQGIPITHNFVNDIQEHYDVVVFSLYPVNRGFSEKHYKLITPTKKLSKFSKLYWLIRNFRKENALQEIDLIHAFWGYPTGFLCAIIKSLFQIPLLIHLRGGDSVWLPEIKYGAFSNRIKKILLRWTYEKADHLVVLSNFQKEKLAENYTRKIPEVISFGVDTSLFVPKSIKQSSRLHKLLHIASLNRVKDQETLIDTLRLISEEMNVELTIMGEDTLNGEVQNYAVQTGVRELISFVPFQPYKKLPIYFSQSDILLHTSLYEAQALVVSEALASGVLVCGTHVGLIADLSSDCTLAVPIKDSKALADTVIDALKQPEKYQDRRDEGIRWSIQHDSKFTIRRFQEVYKSMFR